MRQCPFCNYSLRGLPAKTPVCPECGKKFSEFSPLNENELIIGVVGMFLSVASAIVLWRSMNGPHLFGLPSSLGWSLFILGLVALTAIVLATSISVIIFRKWRWRAVFVVLAFLPSLLFVLLLNSVANPFP